MIFDLLDFICWLISLSTNIDLLNNLSLFSSFYLEQLPNC
jgi:hypothetical protein